MATQVFAYQNDRGLKLSNLEILKAYFMLQIYKLNGTEKDINKINTYFKDIYQNITSINENEDNVLNYYWIAISDQGYNSENTLDEVKEKFKKLPNDKTKIDEINKFIENLIKAFNLVYKFERNESLDAKNLRQLNNLALSYPLLIKANLLGINEELISRLIKFLENITFRNKLRGGRARINSRLNNILKDLKNDQSLEKQIERVKNEITSGQGEWWYWRNEEIFGIIKNDGYFYWNNACNYLLWRYEQYLCEKKDLPFTLAAKKYQGQESIEHIAPQTECEIKPNGYGAYNNEGNPLKGIESGGWIHAIGNLMLIDKDLNSALGNKIFAEKLDRYLHDKTKLLQNKEIKRFTNYEKEDYPRWLLSSIRERHYAILEAAQEIWDLDKI